MLRPRIHGTEMEYSTYVQNASGSNEVIPSTMTLENILADYLPPGLHDLDNFYSNGSRMYVDVGEHLEYATPEDISFMGTIANEIAGEQLLYGAFSAAREDGCFNNFVINKRVVDYKGMTWGYHENYLTAADDIEISAAELSLLGIHLATRNIFCGSGAICNFGDSGPGFVISQKNTRLSHDYHEGTTQASKPLVNLRDEALADREQWRRIHVTSGDPTLSPWATLMKLGTTSLVLRLIEHEIEVPELSSPSLCRIAHTVSLDTSLRKLVPLADGAQMTAAEIQLALCDRVTALAEEVELPVEEQKVLSQWQSACDSARNRPDELATKTDWGARLQLINGYRDKHDLPWTARELSKVDWRFDRISPTGLGMRLRDGRWQPYMPDQETITERMFSPPPTRAALRAQFISQAIRHADSRLVEVNWGHLKICDSRVRLNNPYSTQDNKVAKLLDYVNRLPVLPPAVRIDGDDERY